MVRLFIAVDFSEKEKEVIETFAARHFSQFSSIKWVPKENLHVTLKFLGSVPEEKMGKIGERLTKITKEFQPFSIHASRFSTFNREPLIVLLEIEKSRELEQLASRIDEEMNQIGFPKETRSFYPHVTLGKSKQLTPEDRKLLYHRISNVTIDPTLIFKGIEFVLMESTLKPTGPIYSVHTRFGLQK